MKHTSTARALLDALRAAGCDVYLDDACDAIVSPPRVAVEWPGDVEEAIETYDHALRELLQWELFFAEFRKALREPTEAESGADSG